MDDKQRVGLEAAKQVKNSMVVGLGTGSTATHFIRELARRIREENLFIRCVPSSFACSILARENGLTLLSVDQISQVDLYVDGADEVAPDKGLIKGRGAAMVGEKLLCEACDSFLVIVDGSKLVKSLGQKFPIPVEIMPGALLISQRVIADLGGKTMLRQAAGKDGPVVTDNGNLILDVVFPLGSNWQNLDEQLNAIPGVVEHGLFLRYKQKSQVLVGIDGDIKTLT